MLVRGGERISGNLTLLNFQTELFHQSAPLLFFPGDICGIGLGRSRQRVRAFGGKPGLHVLGGKRGIQLLVSRAMIAGGVPAGAANP